MSFDGSPSSSSRSTGSSDDFAALLDAELLLDKQSSADDENVTAGGSQGGSEQQQQEEEEEEEEEEEDDDDEEEEEEEEEEENEGEHKHEDGDRLDEILEGGSESSQGLGLGFDGVLTTEEEEDKAEDKEGLDTGVGSLQRLRDGSWSSHSHKRKHEENEMDYRKAGSRDGRQEEVGQDRMCPPHPGFMWGVCIRCGQQKSTTPTNDPVEAGVSLRYIHEGLEVSEREAARMRRDELKRVTAMQKLYLVVDLDHTMLNSARFVEVPPEEELYLAATYLGPAPASSSEVTTGSEEGSRSSLHKLPRLQMWTKLRPFAHEFLEEASKMYEMCVYTMGERIYASTVVQLLDPTGRLFGDRVISQLDSTRRNTKDLDVVLGAESAVVILDDTEGVWPNHRANLILMERYHFFTSSTRQFGMKSPSLANAHRDESESEGTLAMTLNTLRHLHREFFHSNATQGGKRKPRPIDTRDVRQVIRDLRAEILAGCKIVFSRIFPTGLPSPQLHPFWQLTEELGAKCSSVCDVSTTHVVALDRGTDKAQWAKQHGVFLVHPSWVEAAQYLWRRPQEADYPVTDDNSGCPVATFAKSVVVEPRTMLTQESNEDEQPGPTYPDSQDNVIETPGLDSSHLVVTNGLEKVNAEHNGTTGKGKEDLIICS